MNAKVLSLFLILVLVNVCIGIPLDGLVNGIDAPQALNVPKNTIADGYYDCVWVCVNHVCYKRCS